MGAGSSSAGFQARRSARCGGMAANGRARDKYLRISGTDYNNYGMIYDYIDVALVPLRNNLFNNCKSPLKMLEAAAKGCAVIASEVQPYNVFPTNTYYAVVTVIVPLTFQVTL